jgi:GNAT superfamily N-acetyltransferase
VKKIKLYEEWIGESVTKGYDFSIKNLEDNEYVVRATKGGKVVGELSLIKSKFKPNLIASTVSVDPSHRRKGIATSMYMFAEDELGRKFVRNDSVLTPDGKSLWDSPNRKFGA